ncbi:hypothetical protein [Spiroplasma platyhelix]|uniref:Uncharacterized protein n=1 Tax=Spiroplasma platyhelix PALS-1 TaxID=1276218 RepID=A0A846TWQ0_9MOLU|nr:hypothetical protein [Spiroplasma platyhelix]MBE4704239.1 hypothetical protein [Spiroplasma platyhelix PALS-1]NKE38612.1 hypothetical protein [Spiroplasma platyhelix PALS-1]UJB28823.1 hypothetical protein SPLAT_v1c00560 [Spiroplasma platyhelix PALS-1]
MFKRFLLLVVTIPTLLGFTSKIVACQWDLVPEVLLVTSYENAQQQSSEDKIIYQKLRSIYGDNLVTAIFSAIDDNTYANILSNLITRFNLKKIFILDPKFVDYLPKTSSDVTPNTNLIRVLQQFTNVDFYFFNNQIADSIKVTNNIYEFRFDTPNKEHPTPELTYGAAAAKHFYDQLTLPDGSGNIDTTRYNFDVDTSDSKWIVRVGVLNNIGSVYQQKVVDDFIASLANNIPLNTKYEYYAVDLKITNSYNHANVQIIEQAASTLYQYNHVNFVFNSNYWYNNEIVHAASSANQTKTTKFIANSVVNKDDYKYKGGNYLMFAYNLDLAILDYTVDNSFPETLQVIDDAPEKFHAYGLNSNLNFVDGN